MTVNSHADTNAVVEKFETKHNRNHMDDLGDDDVATAGSCGITSSNCAE